MCPFDYATNQGLCTQHSFPLTRSQAKVQKIAMPSLFKGGTMVIGSIQRPPSLLRDPPAVLVSKRSSELQPAELETTAPKKRGLGRPTLHRVEQPPPIIPVEEPDTLSDI